VDEPLELALRIIEARHYVRAKRLIDDAKSQDDVPDHPMINMVWEIQHDIAREIRARRGKP